MKWINTMKLIGAFLAVVFFSAASVAATSDDNTATNKRDAAPSEVTADQQKARGTDMEITRRIRQDLMKKTDLSTYAHNIKIITVRGKVTVKGPVRSQDEVASVMESAETVAGAANVINKITVVPK